MPSGAGSTPFSALSAMLSGQGGARAVPEAPAPSRSDELEQRRERVKSELRSGFYDVRIIEIDIEEPQTVLTFGGPQMEEMGGNMNDLLGSMLPKKRSKRRVTVAEAKKIFTQEEAAKLIDNDSLKREAVRRAEQDGIIFIDEMDKIAGPATRAAARTCHAKAYSATFCRSSKVRPLSPSTGP